MLKLLKRTVLLCSILAYWNMDVIVTKLKWSSIAIGSFRILGKARVCLLFRLCLFSITVIWILRTTKRTVLVLVIYLCYTALLKSSLEDSQLRPNELEAGFRLLYVFLLFSSLGASLTTDQKYIQRKQQRIEYFLKQHHLEDIYSSEDLLYRYAGNEGLLMARLLKHSQQLQDTD